MNQGFRLKKINEIRNYLIEEISRNELVSKNHKKVCRVLNYIDHLLIVIFAITWCVSISAFLCLVGIAVRITSSAIRLKFCLITTGIKKYKSVSKKNKKNHDKIILLAKSKWGNIEVLISKVLIHSSISYDEFVVINNVMKEFYDMNKDIKNSKNKQKFKLYIKRCFLQCCLKCRKNMESKNAKVVRSKNGRIMLLSKSALCDNKKVEIY